MLSAACQQIIGQWLLDSGVEQLELLFRTIIYKPAQPVLIADNDGRYLEVSSGASKLFGLSRESIIGRRIDDFAEPASKPQLDQLWRAFLEQGEQRGTFRLAGPDGSLREVEYTARGNVLPERHVLVLRDKSNKHREASHDAEDPAWAQDYALSLLDPDGTIVAWYSGAKRIYGFQGSEVLGQSASCLYPGENTLCVKLRGELKRAAQQGHFGDEGWQMKKDGSRVWANVLTMALRDESDDLKGFARVVRNFSDRHKTDEKLRRRPTRLRPLPEESTIAGIVSGGVDRIHEANDAFLNLVGYSREELQAGSVRWPDLTPPEYQVLDDVAHEEGLRFGACTPFEKELIRKDGTRVPALVTTAVLKLAPFRWITFVQDLPNAGPVGEY